MSKKQTVKKEPTQKKLKIYVASITEYVDDYKLRGEDPSKSYTRVFRTKKQAEDWVLEKLTDYMEDDINGQNPDYYLNRYFDIDEDNPDDEKIKQKDTFLKKFKKNDEKMEGVIIEKAKKMSLENIRDKFLVGEFVNYKMDFEIDEQII